MSYDPDGTENVFSPVTTQGALIFKVDDDPTPLDFESKTRYTVTIIATDPSGDADRVNVTVDITNFNEMPTWDTKAPNSPAMVVYAENGMAIVATYTAKDPEGSGIRYSLSTEALADPNGDGTLAGNNDDAIADADYADSALLKINLLDGTLSFKSPPNYEKPGDGLEDNGVDRSAATDNMYKVVVKATVVDSPTLDSPHATYRKVTVIVRNENEAPVFPRTTDTLEIKENADDPQKEQPATEEPLYRLNRGVGKPSADPPGRAKPGRWRSR